MAKHAIVTGLVRFSFLSLFKPKAVAEGGDPKYQLCILIDKKDKALVRQIKEAINKCIAEESAILGKINLDRLPPKFSYPLRDGDTEKESEEFAGMYFLNAYGNRKPGIVDRNRNDIIDVEEVYSGCYGRADINFYAFAVSGNKGVAVGLNNVQKIKDGPRLDGQVSAAKVFDDNFDDYEDDDDDQDNEFF